ncbi:hypothetical protein GQR58_025713 [Nymphon striatum]|nr:hypothetical protein GQR58_025713 [Nymphon striatum]
MRLQQESRQNWPLANGSPEGSSSKLPHDKPVSGCPGPPPKEQPKGRVLIQEIYNPHMHAIKPKFGHKWILVGPMGPSDPQNPLGLTWTQRTRLARTHMDSLGPIAVNLIFFLSRNWSKPPTLLEDGHSSANLRNTCTKLFQRENPQSPPTSRNSSTLNLEGIITNRPQPKGTHNKDTDDHNMPPGTPPLPPISPCDSPAASPQVSPKLHPKSKYKLSLSATGLNKNSESKERDAYRSSGHLKPKIGLPPKHSVGQPDGSNSRVRRTTTIAQGNSKQWEGPKTGNSKSSSGRSRAQENSRNSTAQTKQIWHGNKIPVKGNQLFFQDVKKCEKCKHYVAAVPLNTEFRFRKGNVDDLGSLDPDVTSTTTGLDMDSLLDGPETCYSSDGIEGDSFSTGSQIDSNDMYAIRKQLEGLEGMYSEVRSGINKRFQRLESHVVTLARSVAHLSSEMRSQHMMYQEIEALRRDFNKMREEQVTYHKHSSSTASSPTPRSTGTDGRSSGNNPPHVNKVRQHHSSRHQYQQPVGHAKAGFGHNSASKIAQKN